MALAIRVMRASRKVSRRSIACAEMVDDALRAEGMDEGGGSFDAERFCGVGSTWLPRDATRGLVELTFSRLLAVVESEGAALAELGVREDDGGGGTRLEVRAGVAC